MPARSTYSHKTCWATPDGVIVEGIAQQLGMKCMLILNLLD